MENRYWVNGYRNYFIRLDNWKLDNYLWIVKRISSGGGIDCCMFFVGAENLQPFRSDWAEDFQPLQIVTLHPNNFIL